MQGPQKRFSGLRGRGTGSGKMPPMPHPLLSDPWVAAKIDKAVHKYGQRWTPEQIEAFREQMAWTLATHPNASKLLELAHPAVIGFSGERVLGGDAQPAAPEAPAAPAGRKEGQK